MRKKTWIIPHEAVESFGRMFLDSFGASGVYLYRLSVKGERAFLKFPVYCGGTLNSRQLRMNK